MIELQQNIWERYGFQGNPFSPKALTASSKSILPIAKAFVGRDITSSESLHLTNVLRNPGGGRLVIEGDIGVGKTSFTNYHRFLWMNEAKDKLMTSVSEISVAGCWETKDFLFAILTNLINRIILLKGEKFVLNHKLFRELFLLNKVFFDSTYQLDVNIFGTGGGFSKDVYIHTPNITETQLVIYFESLVEEILKLGYKGIFLHFDNLELISQRDTKQVQRIFEEIRDVLLIDNVYYIFVAKKGFFSKVISPLERVRSIFYGWPVLIEPLRQSQVIEAVNRRYELLAISKKHFIKPVEDDCIKHLYDLYEGKIRFVMDSLNNLLSHYPLITTSTLSYKELSPLLYRITKERLELRLTPKEIKILTAASCFKVFTNQNLAEETGVKKQNMSKYIKKFLNLNYIYIQNDTTNIKYKVNENIRLLNIYKLDQKTLKIVPKKEKNANINKSLNQRQQKLLAIIKKKKNVILKECLNILDFSANTIRRDMKLLQKLGLIEKRGKTRSSYYKYIGDN